jgi:hypothetical protein
MGTGDLRVAGLAAAKQPAFRNEVGTRSAMDRSVDAASSEQRTVGCVDDDIDIELRDVVLESDKGGHGD